MLPYAYFILLVGWLGWASPFLLIRRNSPTPVKVDRGARRGVLVQALGYFSLFQVRFWIGTPPAWRVAVSAVLLSLACLLSWTGRRALGKQWRVNAGLNADHELIRSGPYRIVRHPIYSSMLCLALGTGMMVSPWLLLLIGAALVTAGLEIRVRVEDRLLESRFGEEFRAYRRNVPAYVPMLR